MMIQSQGDILADISFQVGREVNRKIKVLGRQKDQKTRATQVSPTLIILVAVTKKATGITDVQQSN